MDKAVGLPLGAAIAVISPAQTLTTLATFNSTNGSGPFGALVQGVDGNFYGTTCNGGAHNWGTVFSITPGGTLTTLHSFNGNDGACPQGTLILAANGHFYGTTYGGGTNLNYGTVFEITPGGVLTTLNNLGPPEGAHTYGGLVEAGDADFFGATWSGGANSYGTIFKMKPDGTLTTILSFDYTNGAYPYDSLYEGVEGPFFGTTEKGGSGWRRSRNSI